MSVNCLIPLPFLLLLILNFFPLFSERFNETIFDSLTTYVLNICEVCGSSQCPYCPIYNIGAQLRAPFVIWLLLVAIFVLFKSHRTSWDHKL